MTDSRAQAMAGRLARAAAAAEIPPADAARILAAFEHGYRERIRVLDDPQHPHSLHAARTALILLEDIAMTDCDALALACLFESRFAPLRVGTDFIEAIAGPRAASLAASLPVDNGDETLELLLAAPPPASTVAVAERLDHARHLHLEPRTEWAPFHSGFVQHYLPASERLHPKLGRRCRWWAEMFEQRYLGTPDPG